jgi:surface polysaccharide O-acyltransferase-like enzyme
MTGGAAEAPAGAAPRRHLHAVDLARVLTVALVIAVHTVSQPPFGTTVGANALVVVLHTSREVFFVITALVLVHGYGRGPVRWTRFWRRRHLAVGVPYVAWSAIYLLADGPLGSLGAAARTLGHDLLTGGARYQMYFLLVSMQIYLCLPAIRWVLRVTQRRHALLLAGCAAFQVGFAEAVHAGWSPGGVLTAWVHGPDAVLPSYLLYVMAGGVAAWHLEALTASTLRHRRLVAAGAAAAIAAAVAVDLAQVASGEAPKVASGVFQPVVVVESLAIAWAFLAAGLVWVERGTPRRATVLATSDASFGVYLAHPLLLQGLMAAATATGLITAASRAPLALVLAVLVAGVVPLLYAGSALPAALLRRTPLSLALTGRPRRRASRPMPTPAAALTGVAVPPLRDAAPLRGAGAARLTQEVTG